MRSFFCQGSFELQQGTLQCISDISRWSGGKMKVSVEQYGPVAQFVAKHSGDASPSLRLTRHTLAPRTVCFVSRLRLRFILYWSFCSLHLSHTANFCVYYRRKTRIVCKEHFISLNHLMNLVLIRGAFEMRQSFLYVCSLVRIIKYLYANFSSTFVRGVRISSKAIATAVYRLFHFVVCNLACLLFKSSLIFVICFCYWTSWTM